MEHFILTMLFKFLCIFNIDNLRIINPIYIFNLNVCYDSIFIELSYLVIPDQPELGLKS